MFVHFVPLPAGFLWTCRQSVPQGSSGQSSKGLTQVVSYFGTLGSSGPSLVPDRLSSNVRLADSLVEWSVRLSFALPGIVR